MLPSTSSPARYEQLRRVLDRNRLSPSSLDGQHLGDRTEQPPDDVDRVSAVVDDDTASTAIAVAVPAARHVDIPGEGVVEQQDLAQVTVGHHAPGDLDVVDEAELRCHRQQAVAVGRGLEHGAGRRQVDGQRFLAEHRCSRFEGVTSEVGMGRGRGADQDRLGSGRLDHQLGVTEAGDLIGGRGRLDGTRGHIGDGDQREVVERLEHLEIALGDPAGADQAEANGTHVLLASATAAARAAASPSTCSSLIPSFHPRTSIRSRAV